MKKYLTLSFVFICLTCDSFASEDLAHNAAPPPLPTTSLNFFSQSVADKITSEIPGFLPDGVANIIGGYSSCMGDDSINEFVQSFPPGIVSLTVKDSEITVAGLNALTRLMPRRIHTLILDNNVYILEDGVSEWAGNIHKGFFRLELRRIPISVKAAEAIGRNFSSDADISTNLEYLNLNNTGIKYEALAPIILGLSSNPKPLLRSLELRGNGLNDTDIEQIYDLLAQVPTLQNLDISGNPITAKGFRLAKNYLIARPHNFNLVIDDVTIYGTNILRNAGFIMQHKKGPKSVWIHRTIVGETPLVKRVEVIIKP